MSLSPSVAAARSFVHVREIAPLTWMIRQPIETHFEAPHLFLIVGDESALLLDTGTGDVDVRSTVMALLDHARRLDGRPRKLIVAHTHGHSDHVGGDDQFKGRPHTRVISSHVLDVISFFGISTWPASRGSIDLGNVTVDVLPIPGHTANHVAFFDRRSRILFTGDTLYPGRITVRNVQAFSESVRRLADFAREVKPSCILGAHVEKDAKGQDYLPCAFEHPNERALELDVETLFDLEAVVVGNPRLVGHIMRPAFTIERIRSEQPVGVPRGSVAGDDR